MVKGSPHSFRIFGTIQILQRFPILQIRNWSSTFFGSTVFWLSSSLYFHQVTHIYMYLGFVLLWVECKSFGKCRPRWRPPEAADAHTGDLTHSSSISNTKINVLENKPTLTTRGTGIKQEQTQCPRTDLSKRFLPKPMTTTGWKGTH